jgi:hypothetical protein
MGNIFQANTIKRVEDFDIVMDTWNYLIIPTNIIEIYRSILKK